MLLCLEKLILMRYYSISHDRERNSLTARFRLGSGISKIGEHFPATLREAASWRNEWRYQLLIESGNARAWLFVPYLKQSSWCRYWKFALSSQKLPHKAEMLNDEDVCLWDVKHSWSNMSMEMKQEVSSRKWYDDRNTIARRLSFGYNARIRMYAIMMIYNDCAYLVYTENKQTVSNRYHARRYSTTPAIWRWAGPKSWDFTTYTTKSQWHERSACMLMKAATMALRRGKYPSKPWMWKHASAKWKHTISFQSDTWGMKTERKGAWK